MNKVAKLTTQERCDLFIETAHRRSLPPSIIEKDFWVCWTLYHLFNIDQIKDRLIFKGGTSLSKVFHLIKRFSEDIDLAVDYAPLGFVGECDPASNMSGSKRQRLLSEMMTVCQQYVGGDLSSALQKRFTAFLGNSMSWSLNLSDNDPNTIIFTYPSSGIDSISYIDPKVRLEFGTHAELIPSDNYTIKPFAAEEFPTVFKSFNCPVKAIKAERTFWEKATILHAEHYRPADKPLPHHHARHYYDMALLSKSPVCESSLNDIALLQKVVEHKQKFYSSAWPHYDLATPGSFSLIPPNSRMSKLQSDYQSMKEMIFGDPPPFDGLLQDLIKLENDINAIKTSKPAQLNHLQHSLKSTPQ